MFVIMEKENYGYEEDRFQFEETNIVYDKEYNDYDFIAEDILIQKQMVKDAASGDCFCLTLKV